MIRLLIVALLLCAALLLGGCQTLTSDSAQETQKYSRIADLNRRMLTDDMNAVFLLERPSRLSNFHVRSY